MEQTRTQNATNIWANYDPVTDSLLVYTTGKPVSSVVVWHSKYVATLLDDADQPVGFQIDHFASVLSALKATSYPNIQPIHSVSSGKEAKYIDYLGSRSTLPHVYHRNARQVREFIAKHSDVEPFIQAAWPTLIKHFGEGIKVSLELLDIPEVMAEPELVGWIQCTEGVEIGFQKYEAFEEELNLDHIYDLNSRFNFNIEFK